MYFGNRSSKSFCRLLLVLLAALLTIPTFAAAAEKTVADGAIKITDTKDKITVNNDQRSAKITVSKASGFSSGTETNYITVTNQSGNKATISFTYTVDNQETFTITGPGVDAGGKYTVTLEDGASIDIALTVYADSFRFETATLRMSDIALTKIIDSSSVVINYDSDKGVVNSDSGSIGSGSSVAVTSNGYHLTAVPNSSATFIAWVDASNKILSIETSYTLMPTNELTSVTAVFAVDSPWFYVDNGTYLFEGLATAISKAGSDKVVVLANDATLPSGTYEIPAGYTMLIPFDNAGTVVTNSNLADNVVAYEDAHNVHTLFRELTLSSGTNIQVNGSVSVASKVYAQGTGQDGPYGQITMYEGSSMTLNRGSNLYVFGYIRGSGTIDVTSGANVYESMCVLDYPGSASSTNNLVNAKAFPFSKFTVQNVEVPMTLRSGAAEKVFYNFYGSNSLVGYRNTWVEFFGTASTSFLKTNDYITKSYQNNRQCFVMNGTSSLNDITIELGVPILGKISVKTADMSGVLIPYNFDILVESGTTSLNASVILSKGSAVTINSGATVDIANGKNMYVMDNSEDPQAVGSQNDAKLDINGTVKVSGGLLTSASGANITSSEKTGKIEYYANAASQTNITIKTGIGANYKTISCTPAKLHNADGKYIETKDAKAGDTFTYCKCQDCGDGTWVKDVAAINDSTGKQQTTHNTLQDAVDKLKADQYIKLLHNTTEDIKNITKDIYLDLNGRTVTGDISVTGTYKLYGMDSSTGTGYDTAPSGKIVGKVTGTVAPVFEKPLTGDAEYNYLRYVAIKNEEGTEYTFHRFNISVTGYRFELAAPECALFFIGKFQGDAEAKKHLTSLGFTLKDGKGTQLGTDSYSLPANPEDIPKESNPGKSPVVLSGDAYLFEVHLKRSFEKNSDVTASEEFSAIAKATFKSSGVQDQDEDNSLSSVERNLSFKKAWEDALKPTNSGMKPKDKEILTNFLKKFGINIKVE